MKSENAFCRVRVCAEREAVLYFPAVSVKIADKNIDGGDDRYVDRRGIEKADEGASSG